MPRPTNFEQRMLSLVATSSRARDQERIRWRRCPATLGQSRPAPCFGCVRGPCARFRARGLDDAGAPLPRSERPTCGARTRAGTPCRNHVLPGKTRCQLHGGLSTGPRTPEGRAAIAAAQTRRWTEWREAIAGQVGMPEPGN